MTHLAGDLATYSIFYDKPYLTLNLAWCVKYKCVVLVSYSNKNQEMQIPSSAEIKESVEIRLYSPFDPSWPVLEWTSPPYLHYNSAGLCLFSHYISKQSPTLIHLSYRSTSFHIPCRYQSVSCVISRSVTAVSRSQSSFNTWTPRICFNALKKGMIQRREIRVLYRTFEGPPRVEL